MARSSKVRTRGRSRNLGRVLMLLISAPIGAATMWIAGDPWTFLPDGEARMFINGTCGACKTTTKVAVENQELHNLLIIPIDNESPLSRQACRDVVRRATERGAFWLQLVPENWICMRLAATAKSWLKDQPAFESDPIMVPTLAKDDAIVCTGICDSFFAQVGYPELERVLRTEMQGTLELKLDRAGPSE